MNKIIVIGNGGHAKSCIEVIEEQNQYTISGIISENTSLKNNFLFLNYKIIGTDNDLNRLAERYQYAFIGIGQINSPDVRSQFFKKLTDLGFILPKIISSSAMVSKRSKVDQGTIIMKQALINTDVYIGKNCIINNKALIEHDANIGDNCHIATGAVINGSVTIENNCFIGSNATIMQGIKIGRGSIVSAGSFVNKDLSKDTIFRYNEK